MHYILDENNKPKKVDVLEAAEWAEKNHPRHVEKTEFGNVLISTVFLMHDHNFSGKGPPTLWETMVFNSPDDDEHMDRYASEEEAREGHWKTVKEMRSILGMDDGQLA